jgi:hypothetical protein
MVTGEGEMVKWCNGGGGRGTGRLTEARDDMVQWCNGAMVTAAENTLTAQEEW